MLDEARELMNDPSFATDVFGENEELWRCIEQMLGLPLPIEGNMVSDDSQGRTWTDGGSGFDPSGLERRDLASAPRGVSTAAEASDKVPSQLGPFRIVRQLGRGGMGVVYEAVDERSDRAVALKVMRGDVSAGSRARERFVREGRLAGSVHHPHCVVVYTANVLDGVPFMAMELVRGLDLQSLVTQRGPLPVGQCLGFAVDLTSALSHLHERGIVHRDIKPTNCMVDAAGRLRVLDFGLSRSLADAATLTQAGQFVGTPVYASPEQRMGDGDPLAGDIYSAAATIYFLLTGATTFYSRGQLSPRSIREDVPAALDGVVAKGLARDPDARWPSMLEFGQALRRLDTEEAAAGLPARLGAWTVDWLLLFVLLQGWSGAWGLGVAVDWPLMATTLVALGYFSLAEGLAGRTLGQTLLRLRVLPCDERSRRVGWRAAVRAVVSLSPVGATLWGGPLLGSLAYLVYSAPHGWLITRGRRGLSDRASGTRVVARRQRLPNLEAAPLPGPSMHLPESALPLEDIGGFSLLAKLHDVRDGALYLARDAYLDRSVWLLVRTGDSVPVSQERRELARATRLRWIAGGSDKERLWDAFLPPSGRTLEDVTPLPRSGSSGSPNSSRRPSKG